MSYECFNQSGKKLSRVGKASIQRELMKPVNMTADSPKDYAMVQCPDAEIYITRFGAGRRSCTFTVTWWKNEKNVDYEFGERDKAIQHFMRLRNKAKKNAPREEETLHEDRD